MSEQKKQNLDLLEEDDEFEEFPAEGWSYISVTIYTSLFFTILAYFVNAYNHIDDQNLLFIVEKKKKTGSYILCRPTISVGRTQVAM